MENHIENVIETRNLCKTFQLGDTSVEVLKDINISIKKENLSLSWDLQALVKAHFYI